MPSVLVEATGRPQIDLRSAEAFAEAFAYLVKSKTKRVCAQLRLLHQNVALSIKDDFCPPSPAHSARFDGQRSSPP